MRKILCIRLSALGDMVVTTPVYRALKQQLHVEVHVLTKSGPAMMLAHNPYIDEIVDYTRADLLDYLRQQAYNLVVDLHCNARSHKLRLALGLPSVGYHKRNLEKALLSYGFDNFGTEHLVHRYFKAYQPLGIHYDGAGLDYFIAPNEQQAADEAVRLAAAAQQLPSDSYVVMVIAGTHATKRMPADLIADIVLASSLPIVLLGGSDVRELADEAKMLLAEHRVVDLVDRLPLRVSCAVLAKAETVIATDTGLMHVAAALKKRIVSVWGSTAPPYGMYPFMPDNLQHQVQHAEVQGLSCHPCSKIGYSSCPQGHFKCMKQQSPIRISAQATAAH